MTLITLNEAMNNEQTSYRAQLTQEINQSLEEIQGTKITQELPRPRRLENSIDEPNTRPNFSPSLQTTE